MSHQLIVFIGGYQCGSFSFDTFGGYKHERALAKALDRFEELMGSDCIEDFHKHLAVKKDLKHSTGCIN